MKTFSAVLVLLAVGGSAGGSDLSREDAAAALRKAAGFFRTQVSAEGGYLWRYSSDLARREGEGRATATMAWVQPPGTPTVGGAFLTAWELTGDEFYLDAARETAMALVRGQLRSGGWDYRIEFDPRERPAWAYRVDEPREDRRDRQRNIATLDDDTTQAAVRFLMRVDQALEFRDETIHESARYALRSLLKVQYPNGAWPQRFSEPPDPGKHPVLKASYPDSWPRTWPDENYRDYYTFNDNAIADTIDLMFEAAEIYGRDEYRTAAGKAGDFILLAQMPEPQPAWAQQYDAEMHPTWARRFEPAAVTGGESQGVLRTLLGLYRRTGQQKYLAPIPAALDYLKRSRRADGRLARFYELQTNRPLYFTRAYELTYDDGDLPTHYAFVVDSRLDSIEKEYERLKAAGPQTLARDAARETAGNRQADGVRLTSSLTAAARQAVDGLDERGAWVEPGRLRSHGDDDSTREIIDTRTFVKHVET
ncbi:MAG TPA: pectate lyase, partial [Planctomycetaceae bacterium]|nr:pectate lyase [Planctomycetaceae bacterium]